MVVITDIIQYQASVFQVFLFFFYEQVINSLYYDNLGAT